MTECSLNRLHTPPGRPAPRPRRHEISNFIELAVLLTLKLKGNLSELRSLVSYLKAIDREDFGVAQPLFRLGVGGLLRRRSTRQVCMVRLMISRFTSSIFNLWRRNVRVRQSSRLELGYDDRVALPVLVIILAIIVFIASRLLTIWIVALHSALAIIAFVSHVPCDRSVTSSCILYILVVVMLVLTSVRKIGAVTFLAAVTIATVTHMVAIIIALAIEAHRAGVGILIVSNIHSILAIDIILNGAVALLLAFSSRVSDLFALATLTERARAELLSMTGCLAHRAVLCAVRVVRSMRI